MSGSQDMADDPILQSRSSLQLRVGAAGMIKLDASRLRLQSANCGLQAQEHSSIQPESLLLPGNFESYRWGLCLFSPKRAREEKKGGFIHQPDG